MKSDHKKKEVLLQPIPLPKRKWQQTTNLVRDLPESEGKTAITVFMGCVTNMIHFVPCRREATTKQYTRIFLDHVVELHELSKVIISDWGLRFVTRFWDELFAHLGTDIRFSAAFHPQADGQLQVTNSVIENFLWPYVERTLTHGYNGCHWQNLQLAMRYQLVWVSNPSTWI